MEHKQHITSAEKLIRIPCVLYLFSARYFPFFVVRFVLLVNKSNKRSSFSQRNETKTLHVGWNGRAAAEAPFPFLSLSGGGGSFLKLTVETKSSDNFYFILSKSIDSNWFMVERYMVNE